MRKLSLSFVALAVLSLVPASQAQQAGPVRQANIAAKAHQSMGMNQARAKSFAMFKAWQKTVAFKTLRSRIKAKNVSHVMQGAHKMNAGNKMQGANGKMHGAAKANGKNMLSGKGSNVSLKAQFGKRYKIKQAVKSAFKARAKAVMAGKAAMLHKHR